MKTMSKLTITVLAVAAMVICMGPATEGKEEKPINQCFNTCGADIVACAQGCVNNTLSMALQCVGGCGTDVLGCLSKCVQSNLGMPPKPKPSPPPSPKKPSPPSPKKPSPPSPKTPSPPSPKTAPPPPKADYMP